MFSSLADITNVQVPLNGKALGAAVVTRPGTVPIKRHNPYGWKCLVEPSVPLSTTSFPETLVSIRIPASQDLFLEREDAPPTPTKPPVCNALVQFKCHQKEFSSPFVATKGQYVVVQGDRGIDIGVVIRVNTENCQTYVERSGPTGSILRHATQREVDYWATDLKEDEALAVSFCQQRVQHHGFDMEIRHAEYQFDKKKLTFYYTAKARIDFVQLLKELYREFGCRIWMEKVRMQD
ncbi:PSP1 [Trypanosoma melophagium]|uniref:PSP1 n=1 Tax=Trypanosoma melophagium TaxID=715481 RepID=UPI00351A3D8B|nr:PSP1 [Trypanosoma melophagium]